MLNGNDPENQITFLRPGIPTRYRDSRLNAPNVISRPKILLERSRNRLRPLNILQLLGRIQSIALE